MEREQRPWTAERKQRVADQAFQAVLRYDKVADLVNEAVREYVRYQTEMGEWIGWPLDEIVMCEIQLLVWRRILGASGGCSS